MKIGGKLLGLIAQILLKKKLGFKNFEIGTHSLRYRAGVTMFLDKIPVYNIMIIGCWPNDAFLKYIRKQLEQFSHNVAQR